MSTARFSWSRRGFVRSLAAGSAILPAMLRDLAAAEGGVDAVADPLAPRAPHFPPKAKRVIFLYFSGGVSHIDAWDPKPRLFADHGKPMSVDDPQAIRNPRPDTTYYQAGLTGLKEEIHGEVPSENSLAYGTPSGGSRVIQWGWNPVGLNDPLGLSGLVNVLIAQGAVGTVTVETEN